MAPDGGMSDPDATVPSGRSDGRNQHPELPILAGFRASSPGCCQPPSFQKRVEPPGNHSSAGGAALMSAERVEEMEESRRQERGGEKHVWIQVERYGGGGRRRPGWFRVTH